MTDRERYIQAFSALQLPEEWFSELERAGQKKTKRGGRRLIGVIAAVVAVFALIGAAYAADVGGIQSWFRMPYYGEEIDMHTETRWAKYDTGELFQQVVFVDSDGKECYSIPAEEVEGMDEQQMINEVLWHSITLYDNYDRGLHQWTDDDHRVLIYYFNKTIDVTEYFDENCCGYCELELWNGDYGCKVIVSYPEGETGGSFSCSRMYRGK